MVKKVGYYSVMLLVLSFAILACKDRAVQAEDFETFYQKFIVDEEFQLSRIDFPLDGCDSDGDIISYWDSPEDWTLLTESVYETDTTLFKVEKEVSPSKVTLKVYVPDSGYGSIQEYELQDGKWYLVLYDSMSN